MTWGKELWVSDRKPGCSLDFTQLAFWLPSDIRLHDIIHNLIVKRFNILAVSISILGPVWAHSQPYEYWNRLRGKGLQIREGKVRNRDTIREGLAVRAGGLKFQFTSLRNWNEPRRHKTAAVIPISLFFDSWLCELMKCRESCYKCTFSSFIFDFRYCSTCFLTHSWSWQLVMVDLS